MCNCKHKLVALDLDGTIITSDGEPDPELPSVLSRLHQKGVKVVICTGRRWRSTVPVVEQLDHLAPYVITCGGALIKNGTSHETLHTIELSQSAGLRIVSEFQHANLVPFLLYDRDLTEPELLIPKNAEQAARRIRYVRENTDTISFFDGNRPPLSSAPLIVYTVDNKRLIESAEPQIRDAAGEIGFITTLHQPGYPEDQWVIQVHDRDATKWKALQWLMDRWDIRAHEVVAIGDDVNDIPMLENAGLSFAPANAVPRARAAASRTTGSNDDHGVVNALKNTFF
ncbi:MAG: HAD family hydrolase [Planctomycetota bacterium]